MFLTIDTKPRPRAEAFTCFSEAAPTGYSLITAFDITIMPKAVTEKGLRFFPFCLRPATKNRSRQPKFIDALKAGVPGCCDEPTPLYTMRQRTALP